MTAHQGQGSAPFGETTDPAVFVPRPALDRAVAALAGAVRAARPAAVVGPPGIGKTLVLHRVAAVLADRFEPVHLPSCTLGLDDLCRFALGRLGVEMDGAEPREALRRRLTAGRAGEPGLLLLLDEADGLDRETGEALLELATGSPGRLGLLLAAPDDSRSHRALAALDADWLVVRLTEPLDPVETAAYVCGRLAQTGAPQDLRMRFDAEALAWIHRLSGGIPRRIHEVASLLVALPPDDVTPAWWKECAAALGDASAGGAGPAPIPVPKRDAAGDADGPLELFLAEDEGWDELADTGSE